VIGRAVLCPEFDHGLESGSPISNRWHLHCKTELTDLKSCVDGPVSRIFLRCLRRGRPLTPAVPALIVGLQDADKLGHAGSIPIGHNRNLSIGRGPAPLPEPD
jgi:hypothetical protein